MSKPTESPDILSDKPQRGTGVRRLNRIPMMIGGALAAVVLGVVGYTMYQKAHPAYTEQAAEVPKGMSRATPNESVLDRAPKNGEIAADKPPAPAASAPSATSMANAGPTDHGGTGSPSDRQQQNSKEWDAYYQARYAVEQQRRQEAMSALHAPSQIQLRNDTASAGARSAGAGPGGQPSVADKVAQLIAAHEAEAGGPSADPNGQSSKQAFLDGKAKPDDYLANRRNAPVSPYEVKAGTVIPAIMVGGVNSDLPGQIIGQVTENVYDTATGGHLLIPQGSKLVGSYSSQVTYGQNRVLVAWNRVIFPDASSLDLATMPGADEGGYAGFHDKVNNHYIRTFGGALLMSLFSAGVQLSQPQASNGANYSSQQTIAGAIGQQVGEAGLALAQKNLNIQPTLTIRPGYRFNVMVTKDMIVQPWANP